MKNSQNLKSVLIGKALLITSISLLLTSNVIGQTQAQKTQIQSETNVTELNQLATNWGAIAIQEKNDAIAWATANGYPIRGILPDGSVFALNQLSASWQNQLFVYLHLQKK